MGWFSRRKTEQRSTSITDFNTWAEYFAHLGVNINLAGSPVSAESALTRSMAVMRSASVTAGLLSSAPVKAYRSTPNSNGEGIARTEVSSGLLLAPSRFATPVEWIAQIVVDLLLSGNFYGAIERNDAGIAVFCDRLMPSRVSVSRAKPTERNPQGIEFKVTEDDNQQRTLTADTILHIPNLSINGVTGMSVIEVARVAASAGISMETHGFNLFDRGAMLSGFLKPESDVDEAQARVLKQRFKEKTSGPGHFGDVAVLNGVSFEKLSWSNEDAQWIESRRLTAAAIYELFGLDEHGQVDDMNKWLKAVGLPLLRRIEQRLSRLLVRGQFAEFSIAGLERADLATRYAAYSIGIQNGFLGDDEARDWENLPPRDDLEPLAPNTGTPNAHVLPAKTE